MKTPTEPRDTQMYPSTHWSLIHLATLPEQQAGEGALNRLLAQYYGPLRIHLEHQFRAPRELAEDWLQAFVVQRVLARQVLARADRDRGRFRTFLLHVLDNFVRDELRAEQRRGRRPPGGLVSIEEASPAELTTRQDLADPGEREWALVVLTGAELETRRFYERKGRLDTWGVFQDAVLTPLKEGANRPTDDELACRHGFAGAQQAANAIITAKRQFGKILRDVVRRYAENDADIDRELRELGSVLARSG